ncbi:unnamed protein product [Brachionus calyciflorus]|uniref:Uncharacterized protein n=1 Tax=Brachionus calyciflorus TaxID=104777 RepID=A0A813ZA12_9BILA|nr:unnamed protein product [Brachionus calyciflorus]
MKQSILKKNSQHTNNATESDPIESTNSLTNNSLQSVNINPPTRPVQTSKNVRFIGIDLTDRSEKPPDKENLTLSRPSTTINSSARQSNKKTQSLPFKQFVYSKPDDGFTVVYQQTYPNSPINNNSNKSKNHFFYYQQQQSQNLNKNLRITSASIENRLVKSSIPSKRTPLENSPKQTNPSVTPIRTPILISNLLATANTLTNVPPSTNDKNQNTSYFYYINRSAPSAKNGGLISANSHNLLVSNPVNKLKLKELSNLERIGSTQDVLLSPRSSTDQKQTNITSPSPLPRSTTPSIDDNKIQNPSTLTLYTYLLQSSKNLPKDVRASIIRAQTKQLNNNREELDLRTKLLEDSNSNSRIRRVKLDAKTDQFMKAESRVSSASINTNMSANENTIVSNSVQLNDSDSVLIKS